MRTSAAGAGLRAMAVAGLLVAGYAVPAVPLVLVALVAGLIVRGPEFVTSGEVVIVAEIIVALVVLLVELTGPRRLPSGVAVTPQNGPRLWELVRDVAHDLRVPEPDGIVLSGGTPAELRAARRPVITLRHHLVLGVTVVTNLPEHHLRAVVAHALAHGRRRRPPLPAAIACHGVDSVAALGEAGRRGALLGPWLVRYAKLYARLAAPVVALEERFADRAAARVYGTDAIADGLDALQELRLAWAHHRDVAVGAGLATGCLPDDPLGSFMVTRGHTAMPPGSPLAARAERLRARPLPATVELPEAAAGSGLDGGLTDMLRLVGHLHTQLVTADDEGIVAHHARERVAGLPLLDREAFARQVCWFRAAERASLLALAARRAGAEYPVTLGGVLALLLENEAERLARAYREAVPDGADPDLAAAVADLAACAWVDSGRGRWSPTAAAPTAVTGTDGRPVDLTGAARAAVEGPAGARELRRMLTDAGVSLHHEPRPPASYGAGGERERAAGRR